MGQKEWTKLVAWRKTQIVQCFKKQKNRKTKYLEYGTEKERNTKRNMERNTGWNTEWDLKRNKERNTEFYRKKEYVTESEGNTQQNI